MPLHVYNTLTRKKELFTPAQPPVVRIYTCGLTVYAPMHIGHARTYCFWDFFRRYLEYLNYHVLSVINYTDIDDRIMGKAVARVAVGEGLAPSRSDAEGIAEQRGQEDPDSLGLSGGRVQDPPLRLGGAGSIDVAEQNIARFRLDCRKLKIKDYAAYTRATDFVAGQIELAARLIELGHAYVVDGEVFYDVESFPGYGKLSGRRVEEQEAGASGRVEEDFARKRHPADFTLWKPSEPGQPSWETGHPDWPQGRPGWHLECSVMSTTLLGAHFDVHGGGVDNMFPHHENEIAQSEPVCGSPWVRYWLHPEHLDLRGEKMSKSIGNVIGVPELVEQHGVEAVRWFFSTTHYRSKLPFTDELLASSKEGFSKLSRLVKVLEEKLLGGEVGQAAVPVQDSVPTTGQAGPPVPPSIPAAGLYASQRDDADAVPRMRHEYTYGKYGEVSARFMTRFREALDDDLNTPEAAAALFAYANELYAAGIGEANTTKPVAAASSSREDGGKDAAATDSDYACVLASYRCLTRHLYVLGVEYPNLALHPQLAADCFAVCEGADGAQSTLLSAVIDALLAQRQQARADKDFAKSDQIRDMLAAAGVSVEDTPQGPRWEVLL